jgi:hypothetical protein
MVSLFGIELLYGRRPHYIDFYGIELARREVVWVHSDDTGFGSDFKAGLTV